MEVIAYSYEFCSKCCISKAQQITSRFYRTLGFSSDEIDSSNVSKNEIFDNRAFKPLECVKEF